MDATQTNLEVSTFAELWAEIEACQTEIDEISLEVSGLWGEDLESALDRIEELEHNIAYAFHLIGRA